MKKNSILMFLFLIVVNFGVETAPAQDSSYSPSDTMMNFDIEKINQVKKEVEDYTPETQVSLTYSLMQENFLLMAVSPRARNKWIQESQWTESQKVKLNAALDALATSAAKKLPTYKADLNIYKVRNPAEEKLMKDYTFKDITVYQIYSVGLKQSNWLIAKNDYGIPTARYKHGAFYLRDKTDDHPYCYLIYVNVIQPYAGGGTYGASYARHIENELVGCPAGAK